METENLLDKAERRMPFAVFTIESGTTLWCAQAETLDEAREMLAELVDGNDTVEHGFIVRVEQFFEFLAVM